MVHEYEDPKSASVGAIKITPELTKATRTSTLVRAGIVGARGYSGIELVKILQAHPNVSLEFCFTSDASGKPFSLEEELLATSVRPAPASMTLNAFFDDISAAATDAAREKAPKTKTLDVVFLATPPEVSIELAPRFLKSGVHVIDISGAYRLPADLYPEWYGFAHGDVMNLNSAQYGLIPFAEQAAGTSTAGTLATPMLVSNPGCFVTSVVMALIPLLREKVIIPDSIVIDSKSGTTGAGKKASESLLFSEVDGDCTPYKIGKHQHYPEIQKAVKDFSGVEISPFFSTQLLSARTGILSAIYAKLPTGKTVYDVADAFKRAFQHYPLVRFAHATDAKAKNLLSLRKVTGTPYTHIVYETVGDKLYLYSVIDNLWKGAASQAVENLNRIFGLDPVAGLLPRNEPTNGPSNADRPIA